MKPNLLLKQAREMRGWSQAKVALEIGTSAKIVSRWERGTSFPSPYFREKLCILFEQNAQALGLIMQNERTEETPGNASSEQGSPLGLDDQEVPASQQLLPAANTLVDDTLAVAERDGSLDSEGLLDSERELPVSSYDTGPVPSHDTVHDTEVEGDEKEELQRVVLATTSIALPLRQNATGRMPQWQQRGIVGAGSVLALIALLFLCVHMVMSPATQNATPDIAQQEVALRAALAAEQQAFQQEGIGLSDGRFVFDTYQGRSDIVLKQQAAQALRNNDLSRAVNLLTKATTMDPTDGEAQIYNENVHILQNEAPFVTIVLGLPVDDSADLGIARADMQATFLAQREINSRGGLHNRKMRVLIDNSGANNDKVGQVAQFVEKRVKAGNPDHIIAVVGWPFSSQTIDARDSIAAARLPLVAQTASSSRLSGSSPYFFRVNPSDEQQGEILGTLAVQSFHANKVLILRDPADPYSVSLADAFSNRLEQLGSVALNNPGEYFTEATTTSAQYQGMVQDAVANAVNGIFLAGLDVDAIRLAHAVGEASRADPNNMYLAHLKIFAGDAVATNLLLGQGTTADAAIARDFPQDIRRLNFTAFAHPDEWTLLNIPLERRPAFLTAWVQAFQSSPIDANNAPAPTDDALLTYDAVQTVAFATSLLKEMPTGQAVRDMLASLGKGRVPAYQGVSGRILFDGQGNPVNKAVVVLAVESARERNAITLRQIAGRFN